MSGRRGAIAARTSASGWASWAYGTPRPATRRRSTLRSRSAAPTAATPSTSAAWPRAESRCWAGRTPSATARCASPPAWRAISQPAMRTIFPCSTRPTPSRRANASTSRGAGGPHGGTGAVLRHRPYPAVHLRDAAITTIIWATGFAFDFGWLQVGALDARGAPVHRRGITEVPGLMSSGCRFCPAGRRASSLGWNRTRCVWRSILPRGGRGREPYRWVDAAALLAEIGLAALA